MKTFTAALVFGATLSAATFYGPTPYLSSADSPFNGLPSTYFYLEDFQDGALNTPGVSANAGGVLSGASGQLVDSVEGPVLSSWYLTTNAVRFTFSSGALGMFPTHAGIVWTDVGNVSTGTLGFSPVYFEAFDALGVSLGSVGPFLLGDGSVVENKADDRFFGVTNATGISAIEVRMPESNDWEVDHLQYGASAVPEPGTGLLATAAIAGYAVLRRFQRRVRP